MKLLAIVPRYDDEIVGGSEEYIRRLLAGLAARGVAVRILTTRTRTVGFDGPHALTWPNELPRQAEESPHPVRRFSTWTPGARLRQRLSDAIDRVWRRRVRRACPALGTSYLAAGFHELETWDGRHPFRWSSPKARLVLEEEGLEGCEIEVLSLSGATLRLGVAGGADSVEVLPPGEWRTLRVACDSTGPCRLSLEVSPPFRPDGEQRTLGVAVRAVRALTLDGAHEIPLSRSRRALLDQQESAPLARHLDSLAQGWTRRLRWMDAALKGPLSPGLLWSTVVESGRHDVILATNVPFLTLAWGRAAARLRRRPLVLLPFFHLRDSYHHRPFLRRALQRADRVLCLSRGMEEFVRETWGGRSSYVGGGIDPEELQLESISGARFRLRHQLDDDFIVLTVARKTPYKGYLMTCEAVAELRRRGLSVRFIMVGPDEDGLEVDADGTTYLGRLPRAEVLDALDACDAFVLPSIYESFGLAYLEAWMRGKPVIGHRLCDAAAALIEPGNNGDLVGSASEMAACLERWHADPQLRQKLGQNGRAATLERHTWEHVIARAADALEEVTTGSRTRPTTAGSAGIKGPPS